MYRDRNLLDLAQGQSCLFRIPGICTGGGDDTVAAHSNEGAHGKGGAQKAHDFMSAWACYACHTAYDQGAFNYVVKTQWFATAMGRQLLEWQEIASNLCLRPRNVLSARAALKAYAEFAGHVGVAA